MKHLTILALGSRGDVFPVAALGSALRRKGFQVRLISFENFSTLANRFGLDFAAVPGDAEALLSSGSGLALVESGQNILKQWQALRQTFWQLADTITALLSQPHIWQTDMIINQLPVSLYGRSLAERLDIPLINVAVIPLLRTTAFPMVGFPSRPSFLPGYNVTTYRLAEQLVWSGFRRSINRWRRDVLGLKKRSFWGDFSQLSDTPTLLGVSARIVPRPPDWGTNAHLTGYWLPEEPEWQPTDDLMNFLSRGEPPVFIGFGSMTIRKPKRVTELVVAAARLTGQRIALSSGWGRLGQQTLPDTVFALDYAPYRWLFPQMAALVHHGGSGTTGFGAWAGVPNVVTPFLFDQFYWGKRIEALGIGPSPIPFKTLTAERLAASIDTAVSDRRMRHKAAALGAEIRQENGLDTAVTLVERLLK